MRKIKILLLGGVLGFIITGCNEDAKKNLENSSKEAKEAVDHATARIAEEKKKIVNNLEKEIEALDKQLAGLREEADEESQVLKKRIETQKAKLREEVTEVKNATQENWEDIKKDATLVIENVKKELNEVFFKEE